MTRRIVRSGSKAIYVVVIRVLGQLFACCTSWLFRTGLTAWTKRMHEIQTYPNDIFALVEIAPSIVFRLYLLPSFRRTAIQLPFKNVEPMRRFDNRIYTAAMVRDLTERLQISTQERNRESWDYLCDAFHEQQFGWNCTLSIYSFFQRRGLQYGPDGNPQLEVDTVEHETWPYLLFHPIF